MFWAGLGVLCALHAAAVTPPPPERFVANAGQFDTRVAHALTLPGRDLFVDRDGALVHRFHGDAQDWILVERFAGGRAVDIVGERPLPATVDLLVGTMRREVGHHARLRMRDVWRGIDVQLKAGRDAVETQYDVAPRGDVARIAVALDGAVTLRISDDGGLRIGTGLGELTVSAPIAWQDVDGRRVDVPVRYVLRGDDRYGFALDAYDAAHALHIDPVLRSTFVGGNSDEWVDELALADDSVYVAGNTQSANFPGTTGGAQPAILRNTTLGGNIFVARYNRDLSQLMQATYFGAFLPFGSGGQSGGSSVRALLVDGDSVYITGGTVPGAIATGQMPGAQTTPGSDYDAFVARFNRSLTTLMASSYYGGNSNDIGHALAADATSVYVVGSTSSSNLPATAGAAVPNVVNPINGDAFVARFSRDLTSLQRSTYTRGGGSGSGEGLAALRDGDDLYIAGSMNGGLSQTSGAFQANSASSGPLYTDAFVARFSADLGTLHRASYLGGSASERVRAIAANATAIYLAGDADPSANFPLPPSAPDAIFQQGEGFVFAISRDLSTRIGASLIGGMGGDSMAGVAADATRVVVAGSTNASDFPGVVGGLESANPNSQIAGFVSRFDVNLSTLQQSTYFGVGSGQKQVYGLGIDGADVYLGGRMPGGTLPNTSGAAQPLHGGSAYDGFITRLSADLQAPLPMSDLAIAKTGAPDLEYNHYLIYTIEVRNLGPDPAVGARVQDLLPVQIGAAQWSCTATGSAGCQNASGAGSIDQLVDLPVGGLVRYTLCALHVGAGADVVNTATVSVPVNRVDANALNDSATHTVVDPSLFKDGFEDVTVPPLCSGI